MIHSNFLEIWNAPFENFLEFPISYNLAKNSRGILELKYKIIIAKYSSFPKNFGAQNAVIVVKCCLQIFRKIRVASHPKIQDDKKIHSKISWKIWNG